MSIAENSPTWSMVPPLETPKEAFCLVDLHGREFRHFNQHSWQQALAGGYFDTFDPSNGETAERRLHRVSGRRGRRQSRTRRQLRMARR